MLGTFNYRWPSSKTLKIVRRTFVQQNMEFCSVLCLLEAITSAADLYCDSWHLLVELGVHLLYLTAQDKNSWKKNLMESSILSTSDLQSGESVYLRWGKCPLWLYISASFLAVLCGNVLNLSLVWILISLITLTLWFLLLYFSCLNLIRSQIQNVDSEIYGLRILVQKSSLFGNTTEL